MRTLVTAALSGLLFSLGLGLAGMTDPAKVTGFLDVAGAWDPSLAFVMGGALLTHAGLRFVINRKMKKPLLAPAFPSLANKQIDARLIGGAALFGIGWGLAGYCPGPALTSIATGGRTIGLFVLAMGAGMLLFKALESWRAARVELVRSEPAGTDV